jgi:hypothetical protein
MISLSHFLVSRHFKTLFRNVLCRQVSAYCHPSQGKGFSQRIGDFPHWRLCASSPILVGQLQTKGGRRNCKGALNRSQRVRPFLFLRSEIPLDSPGVKTLCSRSALQWPSPRLHKGSTCVHCGQSWTKCVHAHGVGFGIAAAFSACRFMACHCRLCSRLLSFRMRLSSSRYKRALCGSVGSHQHGHQLS